MDQEPKCDLAAIIKADLIASGAKTPLELKEALAASFQSLLDKPEVEVVAQSQEGKAGPLISVRAILPKLPGQD